MATKLLIVDDEPFTVDMLQTFLQINGFETVGALSGEDGLVLLKVEQPQLVILDLMLPDIEGYEVCQRIRAYPQTANLPVLVLSARAEPTSKDRALAAGADGYMVKPVQFPQLLAELNRLLAKKRSPTGLLTPPPEPRAPQSAQPTQQSTQTPAPSQTANTNTSAKGPEPIITPPAQSGSPMPTQPATPSTPSTNGKTGDHSADQGTQGKIDLPPVLPKNSN